MALCQGARPFIAAVLMPLLACSTPRVVRLSTDQDELTVTPNAGEVDPVDLGAGELQEGVRLLARDLRPPARPQEAARRLFQLDSRSGSYRYEVGSRRLIPEDANAVPPEPLETEAELTRHYLLWCGRTHRPGDCLGLLVEQPTVTGDGRYALAMGIAQGAALGEMMGALKGMANPEALVSAALWTMTMYLLLWMVPEPVSKVIAATLTAALISYVGVDTLWSLIVGWKVLMEEADRSTTFSDLHEAGVKYGRVMGRNAARAFVLLATAAIGSTAADFAAKLPTLPGSALAAVRAGAEGGFWLPAVGEVRAVVMGAEGFTIALAPGALAMAARQQPRSGRVENHHIGTNKNKKSALRGGPWTQRFEKIFAKAGMTLEAAENKIPIVGHKGPHPERYHQIIYNALRDATAGCRRIADCRKLLTAALDKLAEQIATPGTELNQLVTRGMPRP